MDLEPLAEPLAEPTDETAALLEQGRTMQERSRQLIDELDELLGGANANA